MKRYLYILLFLLIPAAFSSCDEWLDIKPETEEREKDLFMSYKGFREALAGCYTTMAARRIYGDNLTMSKIEALACLWEEPLVENLPAEHYLYHHTYSNDKVESTLSAIYTGLFNVVSQANKILEHIETDGAVIKDTNARNVIRGEAHALRAYCQLDVLRLFGQLPQQAQKTVSLPYAEKASIQPLPAYYDYDAYVAKLERDLDLADSLLLLSDPVVTRTLLEMNNTTVSGVDDDFMTYRQLRLNYWAVKAMKARFYLYIGQTAKAYDTAMELLKATVNGRPVVSLSGVENIRQGYFALPDECLFLLSNPSMIDYSIDVLGGDITGIFDEKTQLHVTNSMLQLQLYAGKNTASDNRYLRVWEKNTTTSASNALSTLRTKLQVVPMIRLSEIFLIAMEATDNLDEANALYKEYMASHNVSVATDFASLELVRQEVLNEYRREFYAEGVMFYTYKRLGVKDMLWSPGEMGDEEYVLPLLKTEFDPNQ